MKKDWKNLLLFRMVFTIDDKSNITQFMVNHSMFPGNVCHSTIVMDKCYHGGCANSLKVHTVVYEKTTSRKLCEFDMSQGYFVKFMENVHSMQISKSIN